MPDITIAGALIPSISDTPLDKRTRVTSAADIADIENPFVGMHIYVTGTGKEYVVKTLKSKTIGALAVPNAAIDEVEEVPVSSDVRSAVSSVSAQLGSRMTTLESSAGSLGSATQLLGGRMTTLEESAALTFVNLASASAAHNSRLTALERSALQGSGNMAAGSAVPILAYEEITVNGGTQYVAHLPPDTDLSGVSSGSVLPTTLLTPDSSTMVSETVGSETVSSAAEDLYQHAKVVSVLSGAICFESSLLNSATSSAGLSKTAVSGYTSVTSSAGSSTIRQYRVTLPGAGSNVELYPGRKIWTRAGSSALVSNTIDHTDGNYLYLTTSAPGITAVYFGLTSNYVDVAPVVSGGKVSMIGNRNFASENSLIAGEYNIAVGVNNAAIGAFNDVTGCFSVAAGDLNVAHGNGAFAAGNGNQIADGGAAIGEQNKLLYQGEYALGLGNKLAGIGAVTVGALNTVTGYGAAAFGAGNTVGGKMALAIGNRITNNAEAAIVLGYGGTVPAEAKNKRALLVQAGNVTPFAVRSFRNEDNPLYNPSLDPGSSGKDLNGEPKYNAVEAYRTTYRGQLGAETSIIAVGGSQSVPLDLDQYSRIRLTGSGSAALELVNAQDGDNCKLILDTADIVPVLPAEWQTTSAVASAVTAARMCVLDIDVVGETVLADARSFSAVSSSGPVIPSSGYTRFALTSSIEATEGEDLEYTYGTTGYEFQTTANVPCIHLTGHAVTYALPSSYTTNAATISFWAYYSPPGNSYSMAMVYPVGLIAPDANTYFYASPVAHMNGEDKVWVFSNMPLGDAPGNTRSTWVHIAIVFLNGMEYGYINASCNGNYFPKSCTPGLTLPGLRLGARTESDSFTFNGCIADLRIWNTALSASEIAAIRAAGPHAAS